MKGFIALLLVMILAFLGVVAHMQSRIEALEQQAQQEARLWSGTIVVIDESVADRLFPELTADLHNPDVPPSSTPGSYSYEVELGELLRRVSSDENAIRQAQFEALENNPNYPPPPD